MKREVCIKDKKTLSKIADSTKKFRRLNTARKVTFISFVTAVLLVLYLSLTDFIKTVEAHIVINICLVIFYMSIMTTIRKATEYQALHLRNIVMECELKNAENQDSK